MADPTTLLNSTDPTTLLNYTVGAYFIGHMITSMCVHSPVLTQTSDSCNEFQALWIVTRTDSLLFSPLPQGSRIFKMLCEPYLYDEDVHQA